jgi:hypothetical protein
MQIIFFTVILPDAMSVFMKGGSLQLDNLLFFLRSGSQNVTTSFCLVIWTFTANPRDSEFFRIVRPFSNVWPKEIRTTLHANERPLCPLE